MKFKVISSTLSTNGGYVNRIEGESTMSIFGVNKTTKHRYSIKTDTELKVGAEQELDLNQFSIANVQQVQAVGSEFGRDVVTAQGVVRVSTSNWLHAKGV
jgi:hypothetical protein